MTTLDGPGEFEAIEHLRPIRGQPGQTLRSNGKAWSPGAPGEGEARSLPFYPARDELVVLHNGKHVLEDVRCLS